MKNKSNHPLYNTYRTKKYIVEQEMYLDYLPDGSTTLFSNDTYYLRTAKEDKLYEKKYGFRNNIDGKRVYVGLYKRTYEK